MKIAVIGASGAGKTYFAEKLSGLTHTPCYALDDLFWDNDAEGYNKKRDPEERNAMLRTILEREDWIVEGVQYSWVTEAFRTADRIFLLDMPPLLCRLRIIRRFFTRKTCGNGRANESLRSLLSLLKWTRKFYRKNLPEIRAILGRYPEKVCILSSRREENEALSRI